MHPSRVCVEANVGAVSITGLLVPGEDKIEGMGGLCEAVEMVGGAKVMIRLVVCSGLVFGLLLSTV